MRQQYVATRMENMAYLMFRIPPRAGEEGSCSENVRRASPRRLLNADSSLAPHLRRTPAEIAKEHRPHEAHRQKHVCASQ